jgi:23S rRNA U2552 (ribose-2'-O)-methylase RlmE/FtsJ
MQRKVTADFYFKEARRLGFVARSAFKLQEIQVRPAVPSTLRQVVSRVLYQPR